VRKKNKGWSEKSKQGVSGAGNSQWTGGRCVRPDGYIKVYSPKHPHATGRRKSYVLEHHLVMEKHIGRYLTSTEIVHHINGIR